MIIIHWGCPIKKNNLVDNGGEFYCPMHQTLLETMSRGSPLTNHGTGVSDRSDRFFQTAHVLTRMDVAVTWSLDSAHLYLFTYLLPYTHTHTYTHTYIHTHTHTHIYICTYMHTHAFDFKSMRWSPLSSFFDSSSHSSRVAGWQASDVPLATAPTRA